MSPQTSLSRRRRRRRQRVGLMKVAQVVPAELPAVKLDLDPSERLWSMAFIMERFRTVGAALLIAKGPGTWRQVLAPLLSGLPAKVSADDRRIALDRIVYDLTIDLAKGKAEADLENARNILRGFVKVGDRGQEYFQDPASAAKSGLKNHPATLAWARRTVANSIKDS